MADATYQSVQVSEDPDPESSEGSKVQLHIQPVRESKQYPGDCEINQGTYDSDGDALQFTPS